MMELIGYAFDHGYMDRIAFVSRVLVVSLFVLIWAATYCLASVGLRAHRQAKSLKAGKD